MKNNFKPRSKFERWVRNFGGTKKLAKVLNVNQSSVQHWLAGRATPSLKNTTKILSIARDELTLRDILRGSQNDLTRY